MNVASTVLKRQIFMTHKGRQTIEKMSSQKFTISNKLYAHKIVTMFEEDIIQTNRVYEDRTINVASRLFTRKNAPPPDIIGTNLLTNVSKEKSPAPPPLLGGHVFQPTGTVFTLIKDIIGTNLLTKFHEDLTINKKCTANWLPCFLSNQNLFQTSPRYIRTNIQTKFHYDLKTVVAPQVLSRKNAPLPLAAMRNAPALCSYVFQANVIIFKVIHDIIGKNLLSKFHKDRPIDVASRVLTRKNAPPHDIIGMDRLTKFHEDHTLNVASRVKNPPPLGSHVFQAKVTIFVLLRDIIETNLLTKFHKDWK
ncbi:hypothetical protein DPMN_006615 [Dreissena polymorpha]|uniref:Uncharacterized protein n=1 Tax=Dreissena polymorpha TaxID=45954 RepID=A0A9D4MVI1_DREPO|nr:hypothetical protein DPMN_006615 [Dreissena polymorpha]